MIHDYTVADTVKWPRYRGRVYTAREHEGRGGTRGMTEDRRKVCPLQWH